MRTLILGIGNTLLSDEGVGVHVVEHLRGLHGAEPDLTFLDGGTLSFTLAGDIAAHEGLIVVDAARWGLAPGTVRCLEGEEMDRHLLGGKMSVHEVGLSDLMDIARLSDHLPARRALVGIEPEYLDWGDAPAAPVAAAIPEAAAIVMALVQRWRAAAGG